MIREKIEIKLRKAFAPVHLQVSDESYRHHVPVGVESHFNVVIVSDRFLGLRLLMRHRTVYDVLTEEMATAVHALALHIYSVDEWQNLPHVVPVSPDCLGASKRA